MTRRTRIDFHLVRVAAAAVAFAAIIAAAREGRA
jgi:hypothetical protein